MSEDIWNSAAQTPQLKGAGGLYRLTPCRRRGRVIRGVTRRDATVHGSVRRGVFCTPG